MENFLYEGQDLTLSTITSNLYGQLNLGENIWSQIEANRNTLDSLLRVPDAKYYGINTGFGSLYSISISPEDIRQLQTNLLRSHACGVGSAAPQKIVRLTLLLKIISL